MTAGSMVPMEPAYERNGRHVGRAGFYAIACDPTRHVAVEACAGAGKTWMLVSRILRALLSGCPPHEILAISFTRKAAGEMRQRLNDWLEAFADPAMPDEELAAELIARGLDARQASAAVAPLRGLYAQVLAAGRPVQIKTFHGWFWSLLASAPVALLDRLGLPVNAGLIEDDEEIVAQVWRRFYKALIATPELRADYQALVTQYGRWSAQAALANALRRRIEFSLADEQGVPERSVDSAAARFPEFAGFESPGDALTNPRHRSALLAAAKALGGGAKSFAEKGVELEQAAVEGDAPGILAALFTQKDEPRKFSEKIAGIEKVRLVQDLARRVLAAQDQHDAHQYQQRMTRLARLLLAQFAVLKRERGVIDMNDVERAARHLLADPALGGWLQQRLDARVRHLLIDEFQDTNPLQWQALVAWLSGYAGAGGGKESLSVFIVGDPKQSIYRFRRAEPQVFRAAREFIRAIGGDLLACDHTRRNAPEVIEVVNAVMTRAQADGDYSGFRAHTTQSTQAGGVFELPRIARAAAVPADAPAGGERRWRDSLTEPRTLPEESLRLLECRQAAAWIARQLAQGTAPGAAQKLAPSDVMVLARRREPLSALEAELRLLHIAATQPEKRALGDAPEVQDMVALLDALVSPGHDLSLARALRSPLFGLDDDALVRIALARREDHGASWFDLLQDKELQIDAGRAETANLSQKLARWKGYVDALPPHDALAAIYSEGDVLARFAAAAPAPLREKVQANLRALLSAALALDGARYLTPYALVRALKNPRGPKAPQSVAPDAVRLLTVHGAKGLEAPLVLLLDAEGKVRQGESMGVLVEWPGEAAAPIRFVFLASEKRPGACCAELLATEQVAREREELNALYVAMTRARERLVVSSIEAYGSAAAGGWRSRLAAHCLPIEPIEPVEAIETGESGRRPGESYFFMLDLPFALVQHGSLAIENAAESDLVEVGQSASALAASAQARVGRALHRLLEWASPGARGFGAEQVAAVAREFALDREQALRATRMATAIIKGAAAWAWDDAAIDWHDNGVNLVHAGQVLRLDRLVRRRDSGQWWVLDYKSAHRAERQAELIERMRGYRAALGQAQPGAVVRTAFITADGSLVEVE